MKQANTDDAAFRKVGAEAASSVFTRYALRLQPDPSRTVLRPFLPGYPPPFEELMSRPKRIFERIAALDEIGSRTLHRQVVATMRERHRDVDAFFAAQFDAARSQFNLPALDTERAELVGAFLSQEYAFESAALFNPSVVLHPDQSGVKAGAVRLIFSLRGIGEGHVSSATFRVGTWCPGGDLSIEPPVGHGIAPRIESEDGDVVRFSWPDLTDASEPVLFPVTASQRQGIEDLRLTRFLEEDGTVEYYATYTAFSGSNARSEMLRAATFSCFELRPLSGMFALNKGMALFPRRVDGRYMMLARADNESIWLLRSDHLYRWDEGQRVVYPRFEWEFVQMGNCGPPIELDEGWLVLTHGVGPVRSYSIGAVLLDKKDPARVLARTPKPLLTPSPQERGGYVPNVVYSCGSLVHDGMLLLPYAVADQYTAFASAPISDILSNLR
ncbi:glycoside hydrolase family 130 protein [Sphingobium sp. DC-2]|uniref:glycoside hydrolase family 130 protein n=1 Tax=Sphingobium sp. DC-2 TaxID=1303256 RepID=UPI0009DF76A9|nr:glycoside hydrolase family 130 protein [Sphingobium sp. DC-2]